MLSFFPEKKNPKYCQYDADFMISSNIATLSGY